MATAEAQEVSDEDFQEILSQTRHFVRTAVIPREQEILGDDQVPDGLRDQAKKMGLFGYAIPQQWGGLGLNLMQDVELAMELGYTSLALRSMFGTNNGIAGQVLVGFGTDEQKGRWLESMASGEVVASFALTEPGAGSNPAGLRTKAVHGGSEVAKHVCELRRGEGDDGVCAKGAIAGEAARISVPAGGQVYGDDRSGKLVDPVAQGCRDSTEGWLKAGSEDCINEEVRVGKNGADLGRLKGGLLRRRNRRKLHLSKDSLRVTSQVARVAEDQDRYFPARSRESASSDKTITCVVALPA